MSPKLDAATVCLWSPVEEGPEAEMEAEMDAEKGAEMGGRSGWEG